MARTTLTAKIPPLSGPGAQYFPLMPLTPASALIGFVAGDAAASNVTAIVNGKTMVFVYNSDSAATHTLTIHSVADPQMRTGDITALALTALQTYVFGPFTNLGWNQTSPAGLWIDPSHSTVMIAVITNP